jgi:hypothetical protein
MSEETPLVELKVTNPATYLKAWWNKIVANEGVDFRFHIRPLTAIAMTIIVASLGFGVGQFVLPEGIKIPFFKYEITATPAPTDSGTETLKDTAYTGTLQYSLATGKFYLMISSSSELITLAVPANIDLTDSVGKRILAVGKYNKITRVLTVADAKSLEILPKKPVAVPTMEAIPTPLATQTPVTSPEPEISPALP